MNSPLSGKQKREDFKFLFDELRKTVAQRKEQRRKDQAHNQKMKQSDEKHMQKMGAVPPIMGKPVNPEAGPSDKIPALLTPGEAVIPKKAAQNPKNKPIIKAMVGEGRSDVNLSVPKPKGFAYGTTHVRGYAGGTEEVLDQYGNPVETQYDQQPLQVQEIPAPIAQDFVTTYDPNAVAPVFEAPAPVAAVPTQVVPTDYNAYTASAESGSNPNIGYHDTNKSSAYGTYGITAGTYKDIQKADPFFKDKPITELSVADQTKANDVLRGLNTTRLAKSDIQPTESNLRLAHFLGADGAAEYIKSGKLSNEAIKANGGYEKTKAIADARLAGPASQNRSMAEKAIGVLTGSSSANAADTTTANTNMLEGTKFSKPIGGDAMSGFKDMLNKIIPQGNDLSRIKAVGQAAPEVKPVVVPVPKTETVAPTVNVVVPPVVEAKTPQGAYAQQDKYMGAIPPVGGTQQQQIIRNQDSAFNEPEKVKGSLEKYGDSIASTVGSVWDTIKDPKELGNFVTSFVKDTLGFNGQDAARFGLLVAGSRALGYNPTQAIRYAGNYTLVASDKRAAAKALGETQMNVAMANKKAAQDTALLSKGGVRNAKGEIVSPGFQPTGEMKQMTFDSGVGAGTPINLVKHKEPLSGREVWIDSVSGKSVDQLQKESGNRALISFTEGAGTTGQAKNFAQWGEGIGKTAGIILEVELGQPRSKKNDEPNPKRMGMPTGSEIGSQAASKFREWGYSPDKPEQQNEMNNIISQATRDMINEKRANSGATIKSIDNYIDKQVIMAKTGMDNTLFLTPANKLTPANRLIEQKNELTNVLRKSNADAPEAKINDLVISQYKAFQNEWQGSETVRNLYNKQATDNLSGFYLFAQDRIKESNKRK